jgi:hypothetical protein
MKGNPYDAQTRSIAVCGGRGGGAVGNALSAPGGPVKLIAMADLFQDRLDRF